MPGAFAPANRHSGLGFAPALIPTAIQGAESLVHNVENLFGGSRYASSSYEGAEASRANSYLLGIAAGSVKAGQYLIGQHKSDTSSYAQSYTSQILQQAQSNYPSVMSQAAQAGALADQADGYGGLRILADLNIHYSDQYAGYSTNNGSAPSGATLQLVQQLAAIPVGGGTTIPGTGIVVPNVAALKSSVPMLIGAGLLVALFLKSRKRS